MAKIVTREEILKDYPKNEQRDEHMDELFDSEVLILLSNEDHRRFPDYYCMITPTYDLEYLGIRIRDYAEVEEMDKCPIRPEFFHEYLYLGSFVYNTIGFIGSFITIYQYIKTHYQSNTIKFKNYIEINNIKKDKNKTVNNYYLCVPYNGRGSDINIEKELDDIKKELASINRKINEKDEN